MKNLIVTARHLLELRRRNRTLFWFFLSILFCGCQLNGFLLLNGGGGIGRRGGGAEGKKLNPRLSHRLFFGKCCYVRVWSLRAERKFFADFAWPNLELKIISIYHWKMVLDTRKISANPRLYSTWPKSLGTRLESFKVRHLEWPLTKKIL